MLQSHQLPLQEGAEDDQGSDEEMDNFYGSPPTSWSAVELGKNWGLPPHLNPGRAQVPSQAAGDQQALQSSAEP